MTKCLVGLKDGRVACVSLEVTDKNRMDMIIDGCDSVITMDIDDAPEWKSQVKIRLEAVDHE